MERKREVQGEEREGGGTDRDLGKEEETQGEIEGARVG